MVSSEVLEYYVSRSKTLDVIEPNLSRIRTILDRLEDNPTNYEEAKRDLLNASIALITVWERQNG